jgi:hypothetical protein
MKPYVILAFIVFLFFITIITLFLKLNRTYPNEYIWGKWYESYYGMAYDELNNGNKLNYYTEENNRWFKCLVERSLVVRVSCDPLNKDDKQLFERLLFNTRTIRPGSSNNGGQWPQCVEYIPAECSSVFPKKFLDSNR